MPLRAKAQQERALMDQCYRQSREAYQRGDGALAKELSQKRRAHKHNMKSLNVEASKQIFRGDDFLLAASYNLKISFW